MEIDAALAALKQLEHWLCFTTKAQMSAAMERVDWITVRDKEKEP